MFFHVNAINSLAADVAESEKIYSIHVKTWAGQSTEDDQIPFFCLGNEETTDQTVLLYSSNPDIQISLNKRQWFPAMEITVIAGMTSDCVFIRATADLDAIESDRTGTIFAGSEKLTVNYFLAESNEGDTERSQAYRFSGDNTREIAEFFETDGEAVRIIEYTPLPKPTGKPSGVIKLEDLRMRNNPVEFCNRFNHRVGYVVSGEYYCKAFIGDAETMQNKIYDNLNLNLSFSGENIILLPANFSGFNPTHRKTLIPFGEVSPEVIGYQRTIFSIFRGDNEYHLADIKRQGFMRGQTLLYSSRLQLIQYPGGQSPTGYLPFNEIVNADWKVIHYVAGWSTTQYESNEYDPYVVEWS